MFPIYVYNFFFKLKIATQNIHAAQISFAQPIQLSAAVFSWLPLVTTLVWGWSTFRSSSVISWATIGIYAVKMSFSRLIRSRTCNGLTNFFSINQRALSTTTVMVRIVMSSLLTVFRMSCLQYSLFDFISFAAENQERARHIRGIRSTSGKVLWSTNFEVCYELPHRWRIWKDAGRYFAVRVHYKIMLKI